MKTAISRLVKCGACSLHYDPAISSVTCPHPARSESALLKRMREQGPPYKVEVWKYFRAEEPAVTPLPAEDVQ